jgi:hypothetical protein
MNGTYVAWDRALSLVIKHQHDELPFRFGDDSLH